jgi:Zn-dependent protease with chaperone function
MSGSVIGVAYLPVLAWVGVGAVLLVAFRRSASRTVFRLAAAFLASWALLATTVTVWVLANGGAAAVLQLVRAPMTLFETRFLVFWVLGAAGAFAVFLTAFVISQAVGRGFLRLLKPREVPWPTGLPRPGASATLLAFPSRQAEAFTFTLLRPTFPRGQRRQDVILLSDGLLERLTSDEAEAVVAHELGHIRELDGRYLTFFRTLARMMRWDPVLAYLADSLTRREEYRADLDAVELTHRPRALARALYKASVLGPGRNRGLSSLLGTAGRRGRHETLNRIRRLVALAESGRYPEETGA